LQIWAGVRLSSMRLVSVRQEAHYRGYRIEGTKQGEGLLLRVSPTKPNLPVLKYLRFRTLRSPWVKAVGVVIGYIDEAFLETLHESPPKAHDGGLPKLRTAEPPLESPQVLEELLSQLQTERSSAVGSNLTLPTEDKKAASH
jgi:hypothetical protein